MSVALPLSDSEYNELRRKLVMHICSKANVRIPDEVIFAAMDDGGMGSFYIKTHREEPLGVERPVYEGYYDDSDGIGVMITAYTKNNRIISSIDFWKLDFSSIKTFPDVEDIKKPPIISM